MRKSFLLCCLFGLILVSLAHAADSPQTSSDPEIAVPTLKLMVKPLRKEQLEVEAEAWTNLLQNKVTEISQAEIAKQPPEELVKLRASQSEIIERLKAVTTELSAKGGEVKQYELYMDAVSKMSVNMKDINGSSSFLINWIKSPAGGIKWGGRIISFIVLLIVFYILAAILGGIVEKTLTLNKKCSDLLKKFFINMVKKLIIVIGWVIAVSALGVNVGPLVAGIGAIGFIIGFALQGTLNNFAAGIMILMHRPYDVGDAIKTAGVAGSVESMSLNTTTIKTFDNQIMVVPNGSIWGDVITNITGSKIRRVDLNFGIGYKDDIEKAQRILEDIVKGHKLTLDTPEPNIKLHELGNSSVNFICRPWVKTSDYWTVYWDITKAVKERFDAEGVGIPYPQTDVHLYHETPKVITSGSKLTKEIDENEIVD